MESVNCGLKRIKYLGPKLYFKSKFKACMIYTIFINEYENLMGSFYLKTTLNVTKSVTLCYQKALKSQSISSQCFLFYAPWKNQRAIV